MSAHPTSASAPSTSAVAVRDILCLTDLSPRSDFALDHARGLAERFQAELTVYHAVEKFEGAYPDLTFGIGQELTQAAEKRAVASLAAAVDGVGKRSSVKVEQVASAAEAVVEMVLGRRPDLTVMATHGRRGLRHMLLGSVTEEVVQRAHSPVLCLREAAPAAYRRILVPTDLSLASRLAFPLAAFLARAFGAEVIGLHAAAPPVTAATLSGLPERRPPLPSEAALWEFYRADFVGLPVTAQVYIGPAWDRIVRTAQVEGADLIVMATHGHDSLSDRILGSNTERTLRHAPCPVLVA
jgi:nucleotide-binding universal stress UspA family protein